MRGKGFTVNLLMEMRSKLYAHLTGDSINEEERTLLVDAYTSFDKYTSYMGYQSLISAPQAASETPPVKKSK